MPIALSGPDLAMPLHLEPDAPRAARHHVGQVDSPSPDLRDSVMLLTSELVTRAVRQGHLVREDAVELRVWMPADLVRVELKATSEAVFRPPEPHGPHYDHMLLDQIADRWSIDADERNASIWFEIDRH